MSEEFKKGDVVQLRSGGPKMTVDDTTKTSGGDLHCVWFVGDEKKSSYFAKEALKIDLEGESES